MGGQPNQTTLAMYVNSTAHGQDCPHLLRIGEIFPTVKVRSVEWPTSGVRMAEISWGRDLAFTGDATAGSPSNPNKKRQMWARETTVTTDVLPSGSDEEGKNFVVPLAKFYLSGSTCWKILLLAMMILTLFRQPAVHVFSLLAAGNSLFGNGTLPSLVSSFTLSF